MPTYTLLKGLFAKFFDFLERHGIEHGVVTEFEGQIPITDCYVLEPNSEGKCRIFKSVDGKPIYCFGEDFHSIDHLCDLMDFAMLCKDNLP